MQIVLDPISSRNVSVVVKNVLDLLDEVQVSGDGWSALCPVHDDHSPSLSVGAGANGSVLLYCHAGCAVRDIVEAIGLEMAQLFHARSPRGRNGGK
jgi:hypothetical protein